MTSTLIDRGSAVFNIHLHSLSPLEASTFPFQCFTTTHISFLFLLFILFFFFFLPILQHQMPTLHLPADLLKLFESFFSSSFFFFSSSLPFEEFVDCFNGCCSSSLGAVARFKNKIINNKNPCLD